MRVGLLVLLISILLFNPLALAQGRNAMPENEGSAGREFMMSCTYGVLAGTLVGAASLAFTDKPGDNLNRVARGASLGLYTGILLGLYVVYIVPGMEKNADEDPLVRIDRMPLLVQPRLEGNQLAGVDVQWKILRF